MTKIEIIEEELLWFKRNTQEMKQWQRAYERTGCSQSFIAGLHYAMLARQNIEMIEGRIS